MLRRPPNYDDLTPEDRVVIDEQIYQGQLASSHALHSGDPLLKSRGKIKGLYGD